MADNCAWIVTCCPGAGSQFWAANWVGLGGGQKSTRPGANGVVELSPFEFLDRLADLEPPPLAPARGPPTDWGEIVQAHNDRNVFQSFPAYSAGDRHPQRRGEKIAIAGGDWRFGKPPPDAQVAPSEAHEALGSRKTVAEVPLTGLCQKVDSPLRQVYTSDGCLYTSNVCFA
ncbi:MAG: hypothetical protein NTW36_14295 [Planctomycetia bacterium]|nr:hypothetical protein [Planctomycetia bacterium]